MFWLLYAHPGLHGDRDEKAAPRHAGVLCDFWRFSALHSIRLGIHSMRLLMLGSQPKKVGGGDERTTRTCPLLVGLSAMRSGLARAERGGVHSLSTDCGLDLDGPITVSPYDPPPALLSGSRRLARLVGPTPARAWPTYLPLPESTNETSSPSRGQPPVRADSSRPQVTCRPRGRGFS